MRAGSAQQAALRLCRAVPAVQHPRNAKVLLVCDAAIEDVARLPAIGQFIIGHAAKGCTASVIATCFRPSINSAASAHPARSVVFTRKRERFACA
jgi:hypothetical protein